MSDDVGEAVQVKQLNLDYSLDKEMYAMVGSFLDRNKPLCDIDEAHSRA